MRYVTVNNRGKRTKREHLASNADREHNQVEHLDHLKIGVRSIGHEHRSDIEKYSFNSRSVNVQFEIGKYKPSNR